MVILRDTWKVAPGSREITSKAILSWARSEIVAGPSGNLPTISIQINAAPRQRGVRGHYRGPRRDGLRTPGAEEVPADRRAPRICRETTSQGVFINIIDNEAFGGRAALPLSKTAYRPEERRFVDPMSKMLAESGLVENLIHGRF